MQRTLIYLSMGMVILMMILIGCNKQGTQLTGSNENISEISTDSEKIVLQEDTKTESESKPIEEKKEYELQIMASKNIEKTLMEKEKFEKYGFQIKMVKKIIGNDTFYRIRLNELFTLSDAKEIAEMLEKEFNLKQKIWIQKIR